MYLEGAGKGEGFSTLLTNVGFFSAVILLMPSKRAGRSEHFPALLTSILLFRTGGLFIVLTRYETPGVFLTVTRFRFLLGVNSLLLLKGCGRIGGVPGFSVFRYHFSIFLNVTQFESRVRVRGHIHR